MKYFFDTEFIENDTNIDLVSIGIISEDYRELYLISNEFEEYKASMWVKKNVLDKLEKDPKLYKSRKEIALAILEFIKHDRRAVFWAYYSSYDWVILCQLFRHTINDLPKNLSKYCREIRQYMETLRVKRLPCFSKTANNKHHALVDARWCKDAYDYLAEIEKQKQLT